jgi:hypothetical protein
MKNSKSVLPSKPGAWRLPLLLLAVLGCLFWRSFLPGVVQFSNDGPLGAQNAAWLQFPQSITGSWYDLNSIGLNVGVFSPDIATLIRWIMGPIGLSKFLAPIGLWILGIGAWFFFRQLRLSPLAAALGALAAILNSAFFSDACWGVATHEVAVGMDFFALGLVMAGTRETPWFIRWARLALAGLCVGVNVMEAADIGALFSLFIAAFVFFKSMADEDGSVFKKILSGGIHAGLVAVFAGFIAFQTVAGLIGSEIQGIAGTGQDAESKAQHWDWATQWSEPKIETLGLLVPGLFGYKMDTPKDMMPALQGAYANGNYWGGMGRSPELDRFFDGGSQGVEPQGLMRFSGGGGYCGILVALIAALAIAQSFRRQNSPFTGAQKKLIWFWTAVLFVSLLLAWGRFAPFYALLYKLPYFSTIRNPVKFITIFSWAMVILFGYGVHILSRRCLEVPAGKSNSFSAQIKNWWAKAGHFDRKWTFTCLGIFGASIIGWLIYGSKKSGMVHYLQARGFPDEDSARQIIAFSIGQAGWGLIIFAAAIVLLTLIMAGCFAGTRAKWGGLFLGAFLVLDLGRANLPYIIHWDYKQKYEVGSLNPIEEILRDKPYEHRVAKLLPAPLSTPSQFQLFDQLYGIEWTQHHFLYYNIQSLDIIQMPRTSEDLLAYMNALRIGIKQNASGQYVLDEATFPRLARFWELSNTRYLLGPAAFLDSFNALFDPVQHRFHIVQRFSIGLKPGVSEFHQRLEELTAYQNNDGDYALFDFTGALPRAKLYSNWQVNTNDQSVLNTLADLNFDPAQTVLISTPQKDLAAVATNENSGTVEFTSYAPKRIIFAASAPAPSVLLLNDKYDPNWRVTVDGKPAQLLRCNFIMRGVYLPPGAHTVEFQFSVPNKAIYVTVAAVIIGLFLVGFLIFLQRRKPTTQL